MTRLLSGFFGIFCAAIIGTALNATRFPMAKAGVGMHLEFFLATLVCFGAGALAFEIGKAFAAKPVTQ